MRPNDRREGSLRMLLILGLLIANIVAAVPGHRMSWPGATQTTARAIPEAKKEEKAQWGLASATPSRDPDWPGFQH